MVNNIKIINNSIKWYNYKKMVDVYSKNKTGRYKMIILKIYYKRSKKIISKFSNKLTNKILTSNNRNNKINSVNNKKLMLTIKL